MMSFYFYILIYLTLLNGCIAETVSQSSNGFEFHASKAEGEIADISRSSKTNFVADEQRLHLTYGEHLNGISYGFVQNSFRFWPIKVHPELESFSWKQDSFRGLARGLTFSLNDEFQRLYFDLSFGDVRIPSRLAQTDEKGFIDRSFDRGKYKLVYFESGLQLDIIKMESFAFNVGIAGNLLMMSGGGVCAVYDEDCGKDFGERKNEKVTGAKLQIGFSANNFIFSEAWDLISAILPDFLSGGGDGY